ncbi:MAG: uncharacterized protein KVP18_003330 [Porospora cf. gigantea A]|uniref:uncharacterized protein n=1 Tax=Porospora cf. gigantea A TaxID=2853593 RepID=UPI00355A5E82|nr:MAG: hypothetical protein KVP18_003330 [Porospora cf. gigantea A]
MRAVAFGAQLVIAAPLLSKTVRPDLYYETGVVQCAADDGADFSAVNQWLARGSGLEPDPLVQRHVRPVKSCCGAHAFHQFINRSPRWTKDPLLNNSLNFDSDVDLTQGWLPLKMRARLCDAKSFLYPEHVVDGRPVAGSPAVYSRYDYRWYKPFQQKCQGLDVLTYCFKSIYDERTRMGQEFIETAYPYPTSVFAMAAVDKVQRACDEEDGYLRQAYRARAQAFNRTFAENFDYRYGTYLFRLGVQQPWTRVDRRFLIDANLKQDWLGHRDRITVEHFHQVAFVARQVYDWYWSNVMWTARVSLGAAALVYVPLALCVPRYIRLGFCTSICSVVSCCWLYSLIAGCRKQKRKRLEKAESQEREQQIVQELDEVLESL